SERRTGLCHDVPPPSALARFGHAASRAWPQEACAFSYQPVLTTLTETSPSRWPGAPSGSYLNGDQGGAGAPGGVLAVLAVAFGPVLGLVDRHATPVGWVAILAPLAFFPGPGVGEAGPDGVVQVQALAVPGRDDRVRGDVRVVGLVDRVLRPGQGRAGRQRGAVGAVEREVCAAGAGGDGVAAVVDDLVVPGAQADQVVQVGWAAV